MPESSQQTSPQLSHAALPDIAARPFLLRTLLWLPLCFIVWYATGGWLAFPAVLLSDGLLPLAMPGVVEGVGLQGYMASVITEFKMRVANGGVTLFSQALNALKYTIGLPLMLAIILATPYSWRDKGRDVVYSLIAVSLIQTWGICFEGTHLLLNISPSITASINHLLPYTQNTLFINYVALGNHLGYLIFPVMIPIALWFNRHKGLLEQLATR